MCIFQNLFPEVIKCYIRLQIFLPTVAEKVLCCFSRGHPEIKQKCVTTARAAHLKLWPQSEHRWTHQTQPELHEASVSLEGNAVSFGCGGKMGANVGASEFAWRRRRMMLR